jgi:hypothetical protein
VQNWDAPYRFSLKLKIEGEEAGKKAKVYQSFMASQNLGLSKLVMVELEGFCCYYCCLTFPTS